MKTRAYLIGCGLLVVLASFSLAQNAPNVQVAELVLANHILANEDVVDAYGHVSVRDERDPKHFLLARGLPPSVVTAADIAVYDLDSKPIPDSQNAGYSERFIHGEIYRSRSDVMAVIHFHAGDVIPFSVTSVPLRPMIHMAGFLPPAIPIFEIRKAGGITDMLVRNNALGKALADILGDKPTVLLRGHGAVVAGPSLHVTTGWAYYMMTNARMQLQAMAIAGDKVTYLDPEEAKKATLQDGFERAWIFWKNKLEKR